MCKCFKNLKCLDCKIRLQQWTYTARILKKDMLDNVQAGNVTTEGEKTAFICAAFTVLELLDDKEAA